MTEGRATMSKDTIGKVSINASGEVFGRGLALFVYDKIRIVAERHGARFETPEARSELASVANALAGAPQVTAREAKGGAAS